MTKYYKTVVKVEILSEETPWDGNLSMLYDDITTGDCSGHQSRTQFEISKWSMIRECSKQGTDPSFFSIEDDSPPEGDADNTCYSNEEYVEREGNMCPECGTEDIEALDILEVDGSHGWQTIKCTDDNCGARWVDLWKLEGYELEET
jgi:hypothetical protein